MVERLHQAAASGNCEEAKATLDWAGPCAVDLISAKNIFGDIALHVAVRNNQLEIVKIFAYYAKDRIVDLALIEDNYRINSTFYAIQLEDKVISKLILNELKHEHKHQNFGKAHLMPLPPPRQPYPLIPQPVFLMQQPPAPTYVDDNVINLLQAQNQLMKQQLKLMQQQIPLIQQQYVPTKEIISDDQKYIAKEDIVLASACFLASDNIPTNSNKRKNDKNPYQPRKKRKIAESGPDIKSEKVKYAEAIFEEIISTQNFYEIQNLVDMKESIDNKYLNNQKEFTDKNINHLKPFKNFFKNLSHSDISEILDYLEQDTARFVEYLLSSDFIGSKDINNQGREHSVAEDVTSYYKFMRSFFLSRDYEIIDTREYLFSVANNFFRYFFESAFEHNTKLFEDFDYVGVLRLMYSVIQECLVVRGWNDWSYDCLNRLLDEAKSGKRVAYIGGGCDIHALIDFGIYNITIIDPFLPSQSVFYSKEWLWFIENLDKTNGIGDTIIFRNQKIKLKRVDYKKIKNNTTPQSTTTWSVLDMEDHDKKLGDIIIDRRPCNKNDFIATKTKSVLIAFAELCLAAKNKAWGVDFSTIPEETPLFVKQLHKPIDNTVVRNLAKAQSDGSKFSFFTLGSDSI